MTTTPDEAAERVEQLILLTERLTGLVADQAKAFEARAQLPSPQQEPGAEFRKKALGRIGLGESR